MGYIPGNRPRTKKSGIPATAKADSAPVGAGSVQIFPYSNHNPAIMTQSPYTPTPQQGGSHYDVQNSCIELGLPMNPVIANDNETLPGISSLFTVPGDEITPYFGLEPQNYGTLEEQAFCHQYDEFSEPVRRPVAPMSRAARPRNRRAREDDTVSFGFPIPCAYFS
jgi:hypothetical protein